jgi:hypothetical protein
MLASKVAKLRTTANTSATNSIEPKVRRLAQFKFPPYPVNAGSVGVFLICSTKRVSCADLEVAARVCDVRFSHVHGSLSG